MERREFLKTMAGAALMSGPNAAAAPPVSAGRPIRLAAVGDCILARRLSTVGHDGLGEVVRWLRDADVAFGNCETTVVDARQVWPAPKGVDMNLACDPWGADEFAWAGLRLMGCANNHAMDYGAEGLAATCANLDRAGIVHAGTGMSLGEAALPSYIDTRAGRVALVNCASTFPAWSLAAVARADAKGRPGINPLRVERWHVLTRAQADTLRDIARALYPPREEVHPHLYPEAPPNEVRFLGHRFVVGQTPDVRTAPSEPDLSRITEAIRVARRNASFVVAAIHAHESYRHRDIPDRFLQPFARACIEAGADTVLGAGPHLLRGIEIYRGKPICYSLGNFLFEHLRVRQVGAEVFEAHGLDPTTSDPSLTQERISFPHEVFWESAVAELTFTANGGLLELRLRPIALGFNESRHEKGLPRPADPDHARRIIQRVARLSEPYGVVVHFRDGVGVVELPNAGAAPA